MKLQAPDGITGELHLNGRSFVIDKKGQVEVPDGLLGQSVWQQGYTVVAPIAQPQQKPEPEQSTGKDKS